MDCTLITSRHATGAGLQTPEDVQDLLASGVTHVIDCRAEYDDQTLLGPAFAGRYLWLGVADDGVPKPVTWFAAGISFALPALTAPHTCVYAHCAAGRNRGPSMLYAIMRAGGFPADVAEGLLRTRRPVVTLAYERDAETAVAALGYA